MEADVRSAGDVIILDLKGRLVSGSGDQLLRDSMNELVAEGWKKILLNLSDVPSIDSAGIGELVASTKMAGRFGTHVKILRIGDRVRHVLAISRLLPLFEVYEDEHEALEKFAQIAAQPPGTKPQSK